MKSRVVPILLLTLSVLIAAVASAKADEAENRALEDCLYAHYEPAKRPARDACATGATFLSAIAPVSKKSDALSKGASFCVMALSTAELRAACVAGLTYYALHFNDFLAETEFRTPECSSEGGRSSLSTR
jgi:hypothetical protein